MSVLKTIENIRIPYPTEGVVRTAQLDDTVAPADSAQLAVNMNFDRVGAIQTRPGVTQYADDIADPIKSYGTLHNEVLPPGYDLIFQLGSLADVLSGQVADVSAVQINDTKVSVFWAGPDNDGYCQNLLIDQVTGSSVAIGSLVEFDTVNGKSNKAIKVSASLVLNVWRGAGNDAYAQVFNVSGDTIVPMGTAFKFDPDNGTDFSLAQVDSTHYICFYTGLSSQGYAVILEVNIATGEVSTPGSTYTVSLSTTQDNSCVPVGDGTHFINFWSADGDAQAKCFSVNTGTWGITGINPAVGYDTISDRHHGFAVGDGTHFVNVYRHDATNLAAQAFELNLSTFALDTVGTPYIGPVFQNNLTAASLDGSHFAAFYTDATTGYVQMIEMDPATYNMTKTGNTLSGYDFLDAQFGMSAITLDSDKVMLVWGNSDNNEGRAGMFQTFGEVTEGRWLYVGADNQVLNTPAPGGAWTVRRPLLAQVSKPRFAQYLNYLWMVNGNDQIGGDPVATSNGGDFGTDLVPEFFPKGDFISAGFEGRVWVANKTLGVIYYTDIVQFVPPAVYTLTYNPDVNFITTISPQTGQSFTALFEVPRALLVFTEDTITRIYGATSIDAYAAYNVGTYSSESIVKTKTGIFFHHSSGFYQFDYGSQPVEISRRIIDFVKAIPRSYYDDVTGVYDGFDCVEWSIGPVTVEGVVFSNCVVRYTISTQVWTVYDYPDNTVTAMVFYDDGSALNHIMGTSEGKTGAMDTGYTDFGEPFYFEYIDRWRAFTDMYYLTKSASGFNVYSENAAGANLLYQKQKAGPNAWLQLGTITEANNALLPNSLTEDFDVMRLRIAGTTRGAPVVIHGIEIMSLTIKGQEQN